MKTINTLLIAILLASAVHAADVTFSWTDNSDDEDGFFVEYQNDAGQWRVVAEVAANITEWRDADHPADSTSVAARVKAFNTFGTSGPTNVVSTTKPADPSDAGVKKTVTETTTTTTTKEHTLVVTYHEW